MQSLLRLVPGASPEEAAKQSEKNKRALAGACLMPASRFGIADAAVGGAASARPALPAGLAAARLPPPRRRPALHRPAGQPHRLARSLHERYLSTQRSAPHLAACADLTRRDAAHAARRRAGSRQHTAVTASDGCRLAYQRYGRPGGPVVVLIHGWSGSRHYWDLSAPVLASRHGCTVFTYDQRFHGESDKPAWVSRACCGYFGWLVGLFLFGGGAHLRSALPCSPPIALPPPPLQGYHVARLAADLRDLLEQVGARCVCFPDNIYHIMLSSVFKRGTPQRCTA